MNSPADRSDAAFYPTLYQTLQQHIRQLQTATQISTFTAALPTLQQLQTQIADSASQNPVDQPVLIEVNKQLRLIMTDVMFLKSARQPATIQQRQAQIQQRIALLLQYCGVLLGEPNRSP